MEAMLCLAYEFSSIKVLCLGKEFSCVSVKSIVFPFRSSVVAKREANKLWQ